MDALRVVNEFEWTFNMQRNAKPATSFSRKRCPLFIQEDKTADFILQ